MDHQTIQRLGTRILLQPFSLVEKWLYFRQLRSPENLSLPSFLGIGAQKAGTTWLHENLRRHPDIFLPEQKELHYFSYFFFRSLKSYSEQFGAACGSRVKGEITPGYGMLSDRRIRFIAKVLPDLKLIFLMRSPIDRAWSHALMALVARRNRCYDDVKESELVAHFRSQRSLQRGDYLAILDRWMAHFAEEQIALAFYEDIISRPKSLLEKIFLHLGVSTDVDYGTFPFNRVIRAVPRPGLQLDIMEEGARTTPPIPPNLREVLEAIYRDPIKAMKQRFGSPADQW